MRTLQDQPTASMLLYHVYCDYDILIMHGSLQWEFPAPSGAADQSACVCTHRLQVKFHPQKSIFLFGTTATTFCM